MLHGKVAVAEPLVAREVSRFDRRARQLPVVERGVERDGRDAERSEQRHDAQADTLGTAAQRAEAAAAAWPGRRLGRMPRLDEAERP